MNKVKIIFNDFKVAKLKNLYILTSLFLSPISMAQLSGDLPEQPKIDRDVHLVLDEEFTRPYLPVLQTTHDGRLGINHKALRNFQTGPGTNNDNGAAIRLLAPEKLQQPFLETDPGPGILSLPIANSIPFDELTRGDGSTFRTHLGICDSTGSSSNNAQKNPYNCQGDDCYDLVVITTTYDTNSDQAGDTTLWGTPINVRVKNPKTANAFIESISITGDVVRGATFRSRAFLEPIIVDGKLLVFRRGTAVEFDWTNENNESFTSRSDAVYMVHDNPDSQTPCDITQWDQMYPFSHAPYDSTLNQRYGFAMHPFRDTLGNTIADGVPLGSYPWIDKKGDNAALIMFETPLFSGGDHTYPSGSQYPVRCPIDQNNCLSDEESISEGPFHGRVIFGLWTNGKMVPMDNLFNNSDYGLKQINGAHREIELYKNPGQSNQTVWKRVGSSRDTSVQGLPDGGAANSTFVDTQENLFNYLKPLQPITPKDITWLMSNGLVSEEFSFDDYINPNGFIISEMFQAIEVDQNTNRGRNIQYNGFVNGIDIGTARIANSATALPENWNIPEYGALVGGRIEPVANGGIKGKGLWMDGQKTRIEYDVPMQPSDVLNHDWYISLFIDPRGLGNGRKTLIQFPDNSEISISNNNQSLLFLDQEGGLIHQATLPNPLVDENWTHLAFQISNQNTEIMSFHNGYAFDLFNTTEANSNALFKLTVGTLKVGNKADNNSGFKGWMDDFKIFTQKTDYESVCNSANGTLVGVTESNAYWFNWSSLYPVTSHQRISDELSTNRKQTFNKYACYHNYNSDYASHLQNIPDNVVSIRELMTFPEGPIFTNAPRPDSSQNAFCLSCHTPTSKKGLNTAALEAISVWAIDDPRRTPMQPAPLVYGNIPSDWMGEGKPVNDLVTGNGGQKIDYWILSDDNVFNNGFE